MATNTRALPIYERFASVPDSSSFSPQEAVGAFLLGIEGCAKFGGALPELREDDSAEGAAWKLAGKAVFFYRCKRPVPSEIWELLTGQIRLATADVLYPLQHSQWHVGDREKCIDLVVHHQNEMRPILEDCLRHRTSLSSIFQYDGSRDARVVRFIIERLGAIGDAGSVSVLAELADDETLAKKPSLQLPPYKLDCLRLEFRRRPKRDHSLLC